MYPYPFAYDGSFLAILLMVAAPLLILGLFAWVVVSMLPPSEETAVRIAKQRFARGEIDKEQLGVLLNAL
jgi:uncharacterized membrane protein